MLEEVAKTFEGKLSEYNPNHEPLKFIGYCLHDVSFESKTLNEEIYFNGANFYGIANFDGAMFFNEVVSFEEAKFYDKAYFDGANFSNERNNVAVEH